MARDDSAADSIPVALVATALVIALIIGITAAGITNASPAVRLATVDRQAGAMANDCRFILTMAPRNLDDPGAPQGAFRTLELDLPDGTEYLSFGCDPESGGGCGGTIYYKVCGTKKAIVVDESAEFMAGEGVTAVFRQGRYSLNIEYTSDILGHRYLLISGQQ